MAVEDVIKLVKKVATEVIPDTITFTDVKVEASNVVLYTPNLEIFSDNSDLIRKLAQNVRKRIVIKADSSVRKPIISAKQKLKDILPDEAGIIDTRFDEIPQLISVLRGDMSLIGPRPERPEIEKELLSEFGDNVRFEYDLKKKNWFNIGGKTKAFYKADNLKDLVIFLKKLLNQIEHHASRGI